MSNTLIKFTERVELEVCVGIEDDVVESTNETFEKNEVVDVDIISESLVEITIQFGDGSIALVPRTVFTVIDPVGVNTPTTHLSNQRKELNMSNAFQKEMVTVSKSHLEAIMDYLRDHEFDDMIQHIADGGSHENHIYGHVMALDIELDQHTLIDGVECHNDSEIESQLDKLVNGD